MWSNRDTDPALRLGLMRSFLYASIPSPKCSRNALFKRGQSHLSDEYFDISSKLLYVNGVSLFFKEENHRYHATMRDYFRPRRAAEHLDLIASPIYATVDLHDQNDQSNPRKLEKNAIFY